MRTDRQAPHPSRTPRRALVLTSLCGLVIGLVGSCSGGGSGGGSKPGPVVTVPGTATVLPGVCASGPGPLPGAACMTLTVESLANPAVLAEVRVADPAPGIPLLGTVLLSSGGLGNEFLVETAGGLELSNALLAAGFRVVDRRWPTGWFADATGILEQSARYAVLVDWVRTNLHTTGALCVFGNSGGSSEIAYALTSWDGDDLFEVAILASGPPMTRLDYLCEVPASMAWTTQCAALTAGGAFTCGQPTCEPEVTNLLCPLLPPNPQPGELLAQSILHPNAVLEFPSTEVRMLLGEEDCTSAVPLGLLFAESLTTPIVPQLVSLTPHMMPSTREGRDAIVLALADALGIPDSNPAPAQTHVRVHVSLIELEQPQ